MVSHRTVILLIALLPLINVLIYPFAVLVFLYILFKGQGTRFVLETRKDTQLFLFLGTMLLATIFSETPLISIGAFSILLIQIAVYLLVRTNGFPETQHLPVILLASGGIVALLGIIQYFFIDISMPSSWLDSNLYEGFRYKRVFSTFINPNVLAGYLIFVVSLSVSTLYSKYSYPVLGLAVLCLIFTFSRGGWIGTVIAVITVTMLKKEFKLLSIVCISSVCLLLGFWSLILGRINGVLDFKDSTLRYRLEIWKTALSILKEHPLIGCGFGTAWKAIPGFSSSINALVGHAHNLYLNFAMETGIIGLTAFLGFSISRISRGFKKLGTLQGIERDVVIGIIGGLMGTAFHGTVDAVPLAPQLGIVIWTFLGLMELL